VNSGMVNREVSGRLSGNRAPESRKGSRDEEGARRGKTINRSPYPCSGAHSPTCSRVPPIRLRRELCRELRRPPIRKRSRQRSRQKKELPFVNSGMANREVSGRLSGKSSTAIVAVIVVRSLSPTRNRMKPAKALFLSPCETDCNRANIEHRSALVLFLFLRCSMLDVGCSNSDIRNNLTPTLFVNSSDSSILIPILISILID